MKRLSYLPKDSYQAAILFPLRALLLKRLSNKVHKRVDVTLSPDGWNCKAFVCKFDVGSANTHENLRFTLVRSWARIGVKRLPLSVIRNSVKYGF